jgi:hypothetical protein
MAIAEVTMPRPLETPDDKCAERIGHFKALHGLIVNRDAIESAVTRVRKAAAGYSDEELFRFARLIVLSEHAPSDWRQMQLKRIRNREDALEEIAMSIDSSWMSTETEEEVFMDELRNEVIHAYPNPDREGCPDESALRRAVFGVLKDNPDIDIVMKHAQRCGPCTRQVAVFVKEKARNRSAA